MGCSPPTLSLELRTTACVWGTRTTWWSKPAVGSQTRAGSLWLSRESSEINRCVFCSLVGRVASRLPIAIRDLMNSRSGASRTGCRGLGKKQEVVKNHRQNRPTHSISLNHADLRGSARELEEGAAFFALVGDPCPTQSDLGQLAHPFSSSYFSKL